MCDLRDGRGPESVEQQIISFVWRAGKKEAEAAETLRSGEGSSFYFLLGEQESRQEWTLSVLRFALVQSPFESARRRLRRKARWM